MRWFFEDLPSRPEDNSRKRDVLGIVALVLVLVALCWLCTGLLGWWKDPA